MSSSDIFVVISPGPALTKGDCIVSIGISTRTSCPASCAAVAVAAASLAKGNTENVIGSFRASSEAVTGLVAAQFVHDDGQARGFVRGRQDGEGIGRGFKPDFVRQYALGRQRELARRFGEHGAVGPCVEAFGQRVEEAEYRFGGAFHIARFGGRRIPVFVPRRLLGRILDNGRQIDAHPLEVVDILALRAVVGRQEEDAPLVELEPQYGLEQGKVDLAGSVGQGSRTLLIGQGILPDGVLHLIAQMGCPAGGWIRGRLR